MKKYIFILAAVIAMLSFASCSKESYDDDPDAPSNSEGPSTNDVTSRIYYTISSLMDMVRSGSYVQTGSGSKRIIYPDFLLEIWGPEGDYEGKYAVMGYGNEYKWDDQFNNIYYHPFNLTKAQAETIVNLFKDDSRTDDAWTYDNGEFKVLFKAK